MDRLIRWAQSVVYRALYGNPDRAVVCGFFDATPRRAGVSVVGPIIRDEVRQVEPSTGDYLLVYVSKGDQEYTPPLERAILDMGYPAKVYGAPRIGRSGVVEFKPLSNRAFLEDLAGCRAVFATTGNQLIGEVMHLGKPMLGMPIDCLEQRINALYLDRLGIGMSVKRKDVNARVLRDFLNRCDAFGDNLGRLPRDGRSEAMRALEVYLQELAGTAARGGSQIPRWQSER